MLNDPKSNRIKGVAKLQKKDARSETGLFLLEGLQGLKEALAKPKSILEIFATEQLVGEQPELFAKIDTLGIEFTLVDDRVMKAISDTQTPQGVIAVCYRIDVDLLAAFAAKPRLIALLSNIRDPGNAGTVLRAADAAGADLVIFSENSVDVYNPKVVRSTTGSLFHLNVVVDANLDQAIALAKEAGIQVFAADGGGDSLAALDTETLSKPTMWVMGNEAWGFTPEVIGQVDRVVGLPIYGHAESLNLATAASVCLYATAMAQNR